MARPKDFNPDDVIETSIGIFLDKGFKATSIQDLVNATQVQPGSLYNEFGSKSEIYRRALERFVEISRFNVTLSDAETAPPRSTIEKLFVDLIEATDSPGALGRCLVSRAAMDLEDGDHDLARWLDRLFDQSEFQLCRLIERGQAAGEIASRRDPRDLANFLASTVQGMQLMSRFGVEDARMRSVASLALSILDNPE